MSLLEPADEASNPLLDAHLRAVAQLAPGTTQVGGGEPHVTGLVGTPLDAGFASQRLADEAQQTIEPYPFSAADVERRARPRRRPRRPIQCRDGPRDRVRNIGVVALARPVPVHRHDLPPDDARGEAMDGEIGPLAWPVHREVAQAGDPHLAQL